MTQIANARTQDSLGAGHELDRVLKFTRTSTQSAFLQLFEPARPGIDCVGGWAPIYVASAVLALYLNVFVGVVQAFLKVPPLNAIAPSQSSPLFILTQGIVLISANSLCGAGGAWAEIVLSRSRSNCIELRLKLQDSKDPPQRTIRRRSTP
jgi:hypothetical protein